MKIEALVGYSEAERKVILELVWNTYSLWEDRTVRTNVLIVCGSHDQQIDYRGNFINLHHEAVCIRQRILGKAER